MKRRNNCRCYCRIKSSRLDELHSQEMVRASVYEMCIQVQQHENLNIKQRLDDIVFHRSRVEDWETYLNLATTWHSTQDIQRYLAMQYRLFIHYGAYVIVYGLNYYYFTSSLFFCVFKNIVLWKSWTWNSYSKTF